jgi:hypothetical protein
MFGVFSGYEKQLLRDWIADGWKDPDGRPFRARTLPMDSQQPEVEDAEIERLRSSLEYLSPVDQIGALIPWLSASRHWRPAGLFATRLFMQLRSSLR